MARAWLAGHTTHHGWALFPPINELFLLSVSSRRFLIALTNKFLDYPVGSIEGLCHVVVCFAVALVPIQRRTLKKRPDVTALLEAKQAQKR